MKSFGERVEGNEDALVNALELTEELEGARKAVVNLECMLGAAAASVFSAFEAVIQSLDRLADGGWGSGHEATQDD